MAQHLPSVPHGISLRQTENYLLSLDGVLEAHVLWQKGNMTAHITVNDAEHFRPIYFQRKCCDELGLHQTPRRVVLMMAQEA
ncbi:MAG: hypothetical protein ACOCX1_05405 [Fimbriimonadaceae bacterium]